MNYDALRHFADSWGLLAMVIFFVGAIGWTFRPSARTAQDDASMIPFRDEEANK